MRNADEAYKVIMQWPESEKDRLLGMLTNAPVDEMEDEWLQIAERRLEEVESGDAKTISQEAFEKRAIELYEK